MVAPNLEPFPFDFPQIVHREAAWSLGRSQHLALHLTSPHCPLKPESLHLKVWVSLSIKWDC